VEKKNKNKFRVRAEEMREPVRAGAPLHKDKTIVDRMGTGNGKGKNAKNSFL